jgi:phosphate transport system permease protein
MSATIYSDPQHSLEPRGNLRRRLIVSRMVSSGMLLAAVIAIVVLIALIVIVIEKGAGVFNLDLITHQLPGGVDLVPGIGPALVGTLELVLIATLIAAPVGIFAALYLSEFAPPWLEPPMRTALDVLAGLPTIIVGVFIYLFWTLHHGQSGLAGSIGVAVVMIPLIARASLESISRVPNAMRDAADAVGVARWRTVTSIVLPTASSGIVTGVMLSVARGAGETAPLLLSTQEFGTGYQLNPLHAVPNIPMFIYHALETGDPTSTQLSWGAALVLMIVILLTNFAARIILRRGERKRGL